MFHAMSANATGPMCIWDQVQAGPRAGRFKGLKIRDIGVSAERMQLMGAATVGLSAAETY